MLYVTYRKQENICGSLSCDANKKFLVITDMNI